MLGQRDETSLLTSAAGRRPARQSGAAGTRSEVPDWLALAPHVRVSDLILELNAYLDLGYDVRLAADGWVELCYGDSSFVLVQAALPATAAQAHARLRVVRPALPSSAEAAELPGPTLAMTDIGESSVQAC